MIAIKKNKLKFQFFSKLKDVTPTKKNDPNDRGVGEKQKEAIRQGCEREEGKKKVFLSKKCDVWLVLFSKRQPFCRTFSFLFSSPFFSFKQPTMHKKAQKDQKKKSEGAAVAAEDHSQQQQQRKVVAAEETSEAPAAPVVQKSRIWDPIKTGFIDPLRRFSKRQAWLLCLLLLSSAATFVILSTFLFFLFLFFSFFLFPPPLQFAYQVLNFLMVVCTALMIWKGLGVMFNTESPIVVVLRFDAFPSPEKDLLFSSRPFSGSSLPISEYTLFFFFFFFFVGFDSSGSMEPAFFRGDILFLSLSDDPIRVGDICIFKLDGRDIPIVHRVLRAHEFE